MILSLQSRRSLSRFQLLLTCFYLDRPCTWQSDRAINRQGSSELYSVSTLAGMDYVGQGSFLLDKNERQASSSSGRQ